MTNKKEINALKRFFAGKKSEKGEKIYLEWFRSFDDSKGYLDRLSMKEREDYQNRIFHSLQKKLNSKENNYSSQISLRINRPGKWFVFYRVAAILAVGVLLSFAIIHFSGIAESEVVPVIVERSNPVGQISEITLPDGTIVWLGAASSLEYPEEFSDENRTVQLNGQAFFEVEYDHARPFIVESGPFTTHVLGTAFNVRAYHDDADMDVTLASGKVEVFIHRNDQKQTLEPNQRLRYNDLQGLSEVEHVDASLAKVWTQRELVFIRENFATIAKTFERWHGVQFVFEDETLKEETFVYHFKELSLTNSLIVLNELADFDYEIDNDTVFIRRSAEQ